MSRVRVDRDQGATFVELFFDLVFVYAITQLTGVLVHDLSWETAGQVLLLFWLVWWAWTQFTWTLNLADTEHPWVRLPTLAATAVAFFLAQSIPDALGDAGVWFATTYVIVRGIGLGLQGWVLADSQRQAVTRWIWASQPGLALVLVGGFLDPEVRIWFWIAAFVADIAATVFAGGVEWILAPGHFAERHGLIVIIALGESLIAAGVATAELERDTLFAITVAGAVVATCSLWWAYFGSLHPRLEEALDREDPGALGRFARDVYSLGHAVVVVGVIGVAAAFEEAIAHPDHALDLGGALALGLGGALYLGGLGGAAWRSGVRDAAGVRLAAAAVVAASTPIYMAIPPAAALWAVAGVVVLAAVVDARTPGSAVASA